MRVGITIASLTLASATLTANPALARPFSYAFHSKTAKVDFSWSSEAAAIPKLVRRLHAELVKSKARAIRGGRSEAALRQQMGAAAVSWSSSTKYQTVGQSQRLLSLSRTYWSFTGGAHGNGATTALLWDRRLGREVAFGSLFRSPAGDAELLRPRYCTALDQERRKRRGGDGKLANGIAEFDSCPPVKDLALIPADPSRQGRFGFIHLIAAPYEAGPYVEGEYDVVLPISTPLIAAMKPEYRSSFEAQRQ